MRRHSPAALCALGVATLWLVILACDSYPTGTPAPLERAAFDKGGNGQGGGGGPSSDSDILLRVTIPESFGASVANQLADDGRTPPGGGPVGSYTHGDCTVFAELQGTEGSLRFLPHDPNVRLKPREEEACGERRRAFLTLGPSTPVHVSDDPHEDTTLGELGLLAADSAFNMGRIKGFAYGEVTASETRLGSLNDAFCGIFRFGGDNGPGSDSLVVTRTSTTTWRVETQPYPDNLGWCDGHLDAAGENLLIHVDWAADLEDMR